MIVDPLLFSILTVTTFLFAAIAVVLFVLYARNLKKYYSLKSNLNKKAEHILEEAEEKAKAIVGKAEDFNEKSKLEFDEKIEEINADQIGKIEKISAEFLEGHKRALEKVAQENINILNNRSKDIETALLKNITEEVKAYKEEKLKRVDISILNVLEKVSEDVFGSAIDFSKQEELVIQALEKAKKQF